MNRQDLIVLYDYYHECATASERYRHEANAELESYATDFLRGRKVRRKKSMTDVEVMRSLYPDEYEARLRPIVQAYQDLSFQVDWANGLIDYAIIENEIVPQRGEMRHLVRWFYGRYNQTCDSHYRQVEMELCVEGCQQHGISTEIEGDNVFAFVDHLVDIRILRVRRLSMREFVRRAWKKGANPRVYNPWIPHGFEEREGLDYFGNDLRVKS